MSTQDGAINYPDLLGAATGGPRLNLDVIQCAFAVRPSPVPAGHIFELLLLIQNASDIDVDVLVTPVLPDRDLAKKKGRFTIKSTRLRVGLRPAETGFVVLPVTTSPNTEPGSYSVELHLEIKQMGKKPQRMRFPNGGGAFILQELPEAAQTHMQSLHGLVFSVEPGSKKHSLRTPFVVGPPALASLKALQERKADWVSLWTMADYRDEFTIAKKVWGPAQNVRRQLTRETVFMPLLKATQERFAACGYSLLPPEAIFITKLLTLILEMGVTEPTPDNPRPAWPHWFGKMCRLLFQEPALETQVEALAAQLVYADLVYDAIMYGFTMVSTVTNESFGSHDETSRYADDIVDALNHQNTLDFARAYLPLVAGGLIANARITMPREQIRETVFMLSKAMEKRRGEKSPDNGFIFDITDKLIERALDTL